jgi:DNA-binding transcriptional MerR regulator
MEVMNIIAEDSFFKSLRKLRWHQSFIYRTYDAVRYGLPGFIKNVWRFRRELWSHRWWDYSFTLRILKRSLEIQEAGMSIKGIEESMSLNKKLAKMRRAIELLENKIQDSYVERIENEFGELYLSDFGFEKTENGNYALVNEETEEQTLHNRMIFKKAHALEIKEWKELWQIIEGKKYKEYKDYDGSDLRSWWD